MFPPTTPPPAPKARKRNILSLSKYRKALEEEKQEKLQQPEKRDCHDIAEMFRKGDQRNKNMLKNVTPTPVVNTSSLESSPVAKKQRMRQQPLEPLVLVFDTCENAVTPPPPSSPPTADEAPPAVVLRTPSPDIFASQTPSPGVGVSQQLAMQRDVAPPPVAVQAPIPQTVLAPPPPPQTAQSVREYNDPPERFFSDVSIADFAETVDDLNSYQPVYNVDGSIMVSLQLIIMLFVL